MAEATLTYVFLHETTDFQRRKSLQRRPCFDPTVAEMIISHSRQFIFVHVHKCAGTSIAAALQPFLDHQDQTVDGPPPAVAKRATEVKPSAIRLHKHSTAEEISLAVGEPIWNSYFKFAFIRHPLDRLVSFYEFLHRVRRNNLSRLGLMRKLLSTVRRQPLCSYPDRPPWNWPGMKALLTTRDFSGFIRSEFLVKEQGVCPQAHALANKNGDLLVDFVGKCEKIADDWRVLGKRLGIQATLPAANKSVRRFRELRRYWCEADLAFAQEKYRADFELFHYSIDDIR